MKASPIEVYDACAAARDSGDSTVDALNNNAPALSPLAPLAPLAPLYEDVDGRRVAPTQMLCDSIAHKNNFMKRQLKFLLDHLSEAYE